MMRSRNIIIGFYTEGYLGYDWHQFEVPTRKSARRVLTEWGLNPADIEKYIRN